jgi:hypothetical protein
VIKLILTPGFPFLKWLGIVYSEFFWLICVSWWFRERVGKNQITNPRSRRRRNSNKGQSPSIQAQSNSSLPKPRWVKFIATQLINSRQGVPRPPTGPGYRRSRKHLTIGNTYVSFLISRDPIYSTYFNLSLPTGIKYLL